MIKHYGILAYPAKHSLSPVMHNAAFKAMGIYAQFAVYEVPENSYGEFIERVKHEPINGLAVSLPYKESIIHQCNSVDEEALKIGAVNTVVNRGGFLYGYNTDHLGAVKALEEVVTDLKGKTVVLIGAGGATRAIVYGLLKKGARIFIYNRTKENADKLAGDFDGEIVTGSLTDMLTCPEADILIQTSSIWIHDSMMSEEDVVALIPEKFVNKFSVVMDIVYKPLMTPLLKIAGKLGKKVITGDKMLLYQACEQFKLWTEKEAPMEVMKTALADVL